MAYTEINLLHSQKYYQVFGHLWLVKLKKKRNNLRDLRATAIFSKFPKINYLNRVISK